MRVRALLASAAAGLALLVVPAGVASAATPATPAKAPSILLGCAASPSATSAHQHSNVKIKLSEVSGPGVTIRVTAHYKAGTSTHLTHGSKAGTAVTGFNTGSAAKGQRVKVTVSAVKGDLGWTCSTSFVVK